MNYQIYYSHQAEKYLSRLTPSRIALILKRIEHISYDPFRFNNIAKLQGTVSCFRLRIGDIRVIYELNLKSKTMYVIKIAPRGSIYR